MIVLNTFVGVDDPVHETPPAQRGTETVRGRPARFFHELVGVSAPYSLVYLVGLTVRKEHAKDVEPLFVCPNSRGQMKVYNGHSRVIATLSRLA